MSLTVGSMQPSEGHPKSVAEITKDASEYEFNALVPLKYWLRTADALVKQAQVYMGEGDDEMTYFLLFRHAHLFLSNLSTHPEFKKAAPDMKALEKVVSQNLKALDVLRPRINKRHEEYVKATQIRQARRQEDAVKRRVNQESLHSGHAREPSMHAFDQLRGQDRADVAARLAGQEFSKRTSSRRSYPTGLTQQQEREDLATQMQAIRSRVEPKDTNSSLQAAEPRQVYQATNAGYSYPTVPVNRLPRVGSHTPEAVVQHRYLDSNAAQSPVLPLKPAQSVNASSLPPRPEKAIPPSLPSKSLSTTSEPVYTFAPGAKLENGTPLRTIFLPPTLRTTFLRLAHKNTVQNLETCGFLAGTLRANALFVSALVVPKQTSTSDTCEMTDESELFDYVDQHDLMVLGWIHTHPSQTCFMSSRDLHTHSGYQMMLAESIAIVCAPSKGDTSRGGDWGVYRLTDPPGKMTILQCDKPGLFHPHDVDNVYTDAMRPGHVMEIEKMDFEIVDLR